MKGHLKRKVIVGIQVAKQAVQKLAANFIRVCGLQGFEGEVVRLRAQLGEIMRDRDSLIIEVRSLRKEIREMRVASRRGEDNSTIRTGGLSSSDLEGHIRSTRPCVDHPWRCSLKADEEPERRSSRRLIGRHLRVFSKRLSDAPVVSKKIDRRGHIVVTTITEEDTGGTRAEDSIVDLPATSGLEAGEPWTEIVGDRRGKRSASELRKKLPKLSVRYRLTARRCPGRPRWMKELRDPDVQAGKGRILVKIPGERSVPKAEELSKRLRLFRSPGT